MDATYRAGLLERIGEVFSSRPALYDHRLDHPWLTGALGAPESGVWFVGENPSLRQVERVTDPQGGPPTEEAQWWASKGDRLFREMLVKHGFKASPPHEHGGWRCYITNLIKEADYAAHWRGSSAERQQEAARLWAPVLSWELEQSRPLLIVALGKIVRDILAQHAERGMQLPMIETVQSYTYVAQRPRGNQRPGHPERVQEYSQEFAAVAALHQRLQTTSLKR